MADWSERFKSYNSDLFGAARFVNETAQFVALAENTDDTRWPPDRRLLARQLLIRALSNFQVSIIMLERGMTVEGRILARACLETTFILGALSNTEFEIVDLMLNNDHESRRKLAAALVADPAFKQNASPDVLDFYNEIASSTDLIPGKQRMAYDVIAKKAGMPSMYNVYRQLSGDAAHPTISSLHRYLDPEEDPKITIILGPDHDSSNLRDTLSLVCNFIIGTCIAYNQIAFNPDADEKLLAALKAVAAVDVEGSENAD